LFVELSEWSERVTSRHRFIVDCQGYTKFDTVKKCMHTTKLENVSTHKSAKTHSNPYSSHTGQRNVFPLARTGLG